MVSPRDVLHWLGVAGAVAAFAVYFLALARRPSWVRLLHGSDLLFSGVALGQAAILVSAVRSGLALPAEIATVMLVLAVAVQAWSALRNRRAWDGAERREPLARGETA